MIASLVEFSLRQRILVLGLACLLSVGGVFAFQSIPIDAYPDVTNIQVQVLTEAAGFSPVEVERFITYPLELQMTGLPGLAEIRSLSKFALSQITVVFNDDVDIYFARQLVLERIMAAKERLPDGLEPVMAPITAGLGEVYDAPGHGREDVRTAGLFVGDRTLGLGRGRDDSVASARIADLGRRPFGGNAPHALDETALCAGAHLDSPASQSRARRLDSDRALQPYPRSICGTGVHPTP